MDRRDFLKTAAVAGLAGCTGKIPDQVVNDASGVGNDIAGQGNGVAGDGMTYRTNPRTGEKVSLLGFGMMRLPMEDGEVDQETVNEFVDYALEHGVNYFDTSPVYCQGKSEKATGDALRRHPRDSYFVATKLSNFNKDDWPRDAAIKMYRNSFENLGVDYIDYYLLHAIGTGGGMEEFNGRYIDNGMLDFLLEERAAGRIRNLGFSYHGDISVFDYLLAHHDKYRWDFVQIQLNYLDWKYAKLINKRNTAAEYLYGELSKRGIPAVIMEPLLGGRLANVPESVAARMKQRDPDRSIASWAFRFAGSQPDVLTILSGMTRMEHIEDNLSNLSPLQPLTADDLDFLQEMAAKMMEFDTIPCTDCKYCMPCPYGIDIPAIFKHYNKCIADDNVPPSSRDARYHKARRAFLVGYDRSVPKLRQADHCIGCGRCAHHCPQRIPIPSALRRIDAYVERLKQEKL